MSLAHNPVSRRLNAPDWPFRQFGSQASIAPARFPIQTKLRFVFCITFALVSPVLASDTKAAIQIIRDECINCHRPGKAKGGLLLNTREKMMAGGDSGEVVIAGNGSGSLLLQLLAEDGDPHMPPKKQLAQQDIDVVRRWIDGGAEWDAKVFDEPPKPKPVALTTPAAGYQAVLSLALSPDAKILAAAKSNKISLLNLQTAPVAIFGELTGHTEPIQSLAWSSDGKRLISGGFQRILVWNVEERKVIQDFKAPLLGDITGLAISADGTSLFAADGTAGGAGFIHHFELTTGKLTNTWKGHEDTIYSLKISPDGKYLLSGGADKSLRLWDTTTRTLVAGFEGHTNHVLATCFNKEGTRIASAGADGEIKIWDIGNREQIIVLGDKKSVYTALDWSVNDTLVATTDKGAVNTYSEFKVHDGAQSSAGAKERKLTSVKETLNAVCAAPDGTKIYAAGFDGNVHVWDAKAGTSTPVHWTPNL